MIDALCFVKKFDFKFYYMYNLYILLEICIKDCIILEKA